MNKKLNSIIRGNFYHRKLPLFLYSKKERMKKMNEKKFLQQVYGKLENQLEQKVKLADDSIEISEGDKVIFRVDSKGDMLYSADKQYSNIVNKLHGKIENDVCNTKEFLKVMDNSPELTAVDLYAPYKKLIDYSGSGNV